MYNAQLRKGLFEKDWPEAKRAMNKIVRMEKGAAGIPLSS
jgi:hypothetical protein